MIDTFAVRKPAGNGNGSHFVDGLSLGAERLEARRKTIGASEIAAVCGLHRHRSPLDVYLVKRGVVPDFEGNEYTEWGLRLEDAIALKYAEVVPQGVTLVRSDTLFHPLEDWVSATPDRLALMQHPEWGVEVKNKNLYEAPHFGEPGTDQVPDEIATQCHWSMIVTRLPWWDVAVLIGGWDFRTYRIHANTEIAAALLERGREFWVKHVQAGVEPPVDASKSWTQHIQRTLRKYTEILREATVEEDALLRQLRAVRTEKAQIEETETLLENKLKLAIGECAGITAGCGKVTWKAPKSGLPQWKRIAEELGPTPELVAKHTSEPSRRFVVSFMEG
jgi:putative phage-type endonuclease